MRMKISVTALMALGRGDRDFLLELEGVADRCNVREVGEMDANEEPWEVALDEGYWQALLREGEHPTSAAPPPEVGEVWRGLGLDQGPGEEVPQEAGAERIQREEDWRAAQQSMENGDILELEVTGYNRGGLLVTLGGLRGFVPASQLLKPPRQADEEGRMAELASRVGEVLSLKIIELDRDRNRLILSERAANTEETQAEKLLAEICEGDIRRGRVTNLCSFGAFVDLGGIEGLIHISELSWGRVAHPSDVLKSGEEVEVYVLNVDRERRRIGLSLRRLKPDPWSTVEERYHVGQIVQGVITNVVSFGAFARLEEGLEGLIHISELAEGNFLHPRNVVKEGDVVTARIIHIDGKNHRLGLSLRQVNNVQEDKSGSDSDDDFYFNEAPFES